ncbi:MAG: hypothetical protein AAFY02_13405 [Pseudomonadota bacterium]
MARLIWQGAAPRTEGPAPSAPLLLSWRRRGQLLRQDWRAGPDLEQTIASLAARRPDQADAALLTLPQACWQVPETGWHAVFADAQRGILGLGIACQERAAWFAPSDLIATNRSFPRALAWQLERWQLSEEAFLAADGELSATSCQEILIPRKGAARVLTRGRCLRPLPDDLEEMAAELAAWLLAQQSEDGALAYAYWPSRGDYSPSNNTIRQFMASLVLIDWAAYRQDSSLLTAATASLEANLQRYLRHEGELAVIDFEGKAKLGAAALAALCLLRHPEAARYRETRLALEAGILALWQDDGRFRTFHRPAERNDNQNFYPGEALTYWAERLAREPDKALRDRVWQSLESYQRFHRADPNPAFVPWHSLAITKTQPDRRWAERVFAMNDWLLALQQWEEAPHPDLAGRFYAPQNPEYGPPHASSTGVYLEGLTAAFALAQASGESERAARYATAIWRGLWNLRQLQFLDAADFFYISKRRRVLGGLRTEAYDNRLRLDNSQHALAALLAILAQPALLATRPRPEALQPPAGRLAAGFASQ